MSVIEIYKLGIKAGLTENEATAAANSVVGVDFFNDQFNKVATKEDILNLKVELIKAINDSMIRMTAIFAVILSMVVGLATYFGK